MANSTHSAAQPEIFMWVCGHCEKPTPHHRYPDVEGAPPTQCSICGAQPFAALETGKENGPGMGFTGSKILDAAVWALAVFFIGFLLLHTAPQLAWLRDLLFNDQI